MVADGSNTTNTDNTSAPKFNEYNFNLWYKFFVAFLMRKDRAHLVLTKDIPEHISDIDSTSQQGTPMTDKQKAKVRSARKKWRKRNEVAYSFAMEVCNQHETAKTIAALYSGTSAKGLIERLRERFLRTWKKIPFSPKSLSSIQCTYCHSNPVQSTWMT